jgi:hypothetical protein
MLPVESSKEINMLISVVYGATDDRIGILHAATYILFARLAPLCHVNKRS